jgi:SAM-dependent methyltransferase
MKNSSGTEADASLWDSFYKNHKVPWQSSGLADITRRYLGEYAKGRSALEIGCGTGEDAAEFRRLGFEYSGFDISEEAIRIAKDLHPKYSKSFFVGDIFALDASSKFSVIYDKGVFHNLAGPKRREEFVRNVASTSEKNGVWITVCGSADFYDPKVPHGAIFLQHLIAPAEMYFEALEIVKAPYGTKNSKFDGWYGVFRRR